MWLSKGVSFAAFLVPHHEFENIPHDGFGAFKEKDN
jgi:hypothetical protein